MAITAISRDWGVEPSIVRVTSTNNYAEITASNYYLLQTADVSLINNGSFEFLDGDIICITYSDGKGFFTYDSVNNTFIELTIPANSLDLTSGHIFVGNANNEAADVALTGQLSITNTGVGSVVPGAITQLEIEPSNRYKATLIYADTRHSTLASGSLQTFNTPGLVNTDFLQVQLLGIGSFPTLTIQWAQIVTGTVLVQFSEDPSDEALFCILAWRATAPAT